MIKIGKFISKKEIELLKIFENMSNLEFKKVCILLEINEAFLRRCIKNLNSLFEDDKTEKIIIKNKRIIFTFDKIKLKNNLTINLDSKERMYYIVSLLIFEKKITLTSIASILNISFNTCLNDLNQVKKFLKNFNLEVESQIFSGISLKGNSIDKNSFSIKLITKFLIEKELNPQTYDFLSKYINPFYFSYFEKKIKTFNSIELNRIVNKIIEKIECKFNINFDLFLVKTLKSIFIFFSLTKDINNSNSSYAYSGLKKDIYLEILNISKLNNYLFSNDIIFFTVSILYENISIKKIKNNNFNVIHNLIKEFYNTSLTEDDSDVLQHMIKQYEYKFLFEIKMYNKNYITNSIVPKSIYKDLQVALRKNKINFFNEDIYMICLFIYYSVTNYYSKIEPEKTMLLCDNSYQYWISKNLLLELKRYLPKIKVDICSNHLLNQNNYNFNQYDYIIFLDKYSKYTYFFKDEQYKNKIIYFNYNDHFEINSFWGHLFFNKIN